MKEPRKLATIVVLVSTIVLFTLIGLALMIGMSVFRSHYISIHTERLGDPSLVEITRVLQKAPDLYKSQRNWYFILNIEGVAANLMTPRKYSYGDLAFQVKLALENLEAGDTVTAVVLQQEFNACQNWLDTAVVLGQWPWDKHIQVVGLRANGNVLFDKTHQDKTSHNLELEYLASYGGMVFVVVLLLLGLLAMWFLKWIETQFNIPIFSAFRH